MQRTLDEERSSFQEQVRNLKSQHEAAFEAEEKKYQRRLTSLQERLNAKDKEYAEIFEKEQHNPTTESDVEKEKIIESLNIQLAKNQEEMAKLRESNSESEDENDEDDSTPTNQASNSFFFFCTCCIIYIHSKVPPFRLKLPLPLPRNINSWNHYTNHCEKSSKRPSWH